MKYALLAFLLSSCALQRDVSSIQREESPRHASEPEVEYIDPYEAVKIYTRDFPVTSEIGTAEHEREFRKTLCAGLEVKDCNDKYENMVHERMYNHYRVASVELSKKFCKAYPVECKDIKLIESWYILSWNQYIDNLKKYNLAPPSRFPWEK